MDKRLGYIDSLRGFAAVAVVYFHTAHRYWIDGSVQNPLEQAIFGLAADQFDFGKIAVTVFFAISGFVIPYSLFKPSNTPLRDFAITRFFRLYPIYWVSIFVWVGFLAAAQGAVTPLAQIMVNVTMLQQFVGVKNIIELFWTLQIELVFYALCAMLFALGWLRSCRNIALTSVVMLGLALLLAVARWQLQRKLPVALPLALCIMFWGFLWRRAFVERAPEARALIGRLTALLFVTLVPICLLAYSHDFGFHETWYRYLDTYIAALSLFMLFTTRFKVTTAAAVFLGQISYSVYLFGPLGQEFAMALHPLLPANAPIHLTVTLAIAATLAIATLTFYLVEKPAIRLGRQLKKGLNAGRDKGAVLAAPESRV
jgi:peptidoglycan/LPS O-acetylase OafA/YrhL